MNICFPSLSYPMNGGATSGVGSQVRLLAHSLIEAGNSISVIDLAENQQLTTTDDRGAKVHRMTSGKLHWFARKLPLVGKMLALPNREIEYSIRAWRGVRRANKNGKLDLIEGTETGMLLVALFCREVPVIIRLHGEQYTFHKYTPGLRLTLAVRLSRVLQRIALRRAKLLISPSYAHAHEIQSELGTSHPPIAVVPNSLSLEKIRADCRLDRSTKTVLYVGRIEQRKGIATLLQAAAQMKKTLPESRFVFAGDFHSSLSQSEFQSLVHLHGLDSQVELLGPVGWNVLSDWYQRSAVSVLPSFYEWCRGEAGSAENSHLFFSPHLDDAVLSCGGMIHSLVSQNKSVQVITVFAGDANAGLSAFARHLHAKWDPATDLFEQRRREDSRALSELGVKNFERCNFAEAPYRRAIDGNYVYGTYEELRGQLASEDRLLKDIITERILKRLENLPDTTILYFPLSLGRHVDHRLLFDIGLELNAAGKHVRFYEDYPYAAAYDPDHRGLNWLPTTVPIAIEPKVRAASAYTTQIRGLGGSVRNLEKRLRAFGSAVGKQSISERYWEIAIPASLQNGKRNELDCPLVLRNTAPKFPDFKDFLRTFRWHDLEEVLPPGGGNCLDLGCGTGRHSAVIQGKGYKWLGLDRSNSSVLNLQSDGTAIPLQSGTMAAVVAWQVFEYLEHPEKAIAEAARVLEAGGVFCGSVSFLEPVHGRTYFNISPLILEKLLAEHGFGDIEIKAGLNGFALILWTWLRRSGIPFIDRLAIPIAFAMFAPPAALMFFGSWLAQRLGFGGGHMMESISKKTPLEFAGHVMFSARKRART